MPTSLTISVALPAPASLGRMERPASPYRQQLPPTSPSPRGTSPAAAALKPPGGALTISTAAGGADSPPALGTESSEGEGAGRQGGAGRLSLGGSGSGRGSGSGGLPQTPRAAVALKQRTPFAASGSAEALLFVWDAERARPSSAILAVARGALDEPGSPAASSAARTCDSFGTLSGMVGGIGSSLESAPPPPALSMSMRRSGSDAGGAAPAGPSPYLATSSILSQTALTLRTEAHSTSGAIPTPPATATSRGLSRAPSMGRSLSAPGTDPLLATAALGARKALPAASGAPAGASPPLSFSGDGRQPVPPGAPKPVGAGSFRRSHAGGVAQEPLQGGSGPAAPAHHAPSVTL